MGADQSKGNIYKGERGQSTSENDPNVVSSSSINRARSPSSTSLRSEPGFLFSSYNDAENFTSASDDLSNTQRRASDAQELEASTGSKGTSQSVFRVPRSLTDAAGSISKDLESGSVLNKPKGPKMIHTGRKVVVVKPKDATADRRTEGQLELNRLSSIPRFLPIIRHSVTNLNTNSAAFSAAAPPLVTMNSIAGEVPLSGVSATIGSPVSNAPNYGSSSIQAYNFMASSSGSPQQFPSKRSIPGSGTASLGRVDFRGVFHLAARYQEHLKQCAEAVTFDQNTLCVAMKDVDGQAQQLVLALNERQKKYARLVDQLSKISEMKRVLTRMRSSMQWLSNSLNQLNEALPPNLQLDSFTCSPHNAEIGVEPNENDLSTESVVSSDIVVAR